jgi:iron complex outermembrane receptor protein
MSQSLKGVGSLTLPIRLAGSVAIVALMPVLASVPAFAQATQTAQAAPQTETIEVTGSRIKNVDAASANPITVVSSEDIARSSSTTTEEVLRKLPAVDFTGGISSNSTNGGNGTAAIGLRNLGAVRTLILVNGQRMVPTDIGAAVSLVDLNNIPVQMIDHIDVLKDGASSIYGADAIGGVVNIVLKKHYAGVSVDLDFGITDKADGLKFGVSSTIGSDFDRGNVLLNVTHDHEDPVFQRDRQFSSDQHGDSDFGFPAISSRIQGARATIVTTPGGTKQPFLFGNNNQFFNENNPPANFRSIVPPLDISDPRLGSQTFFDITQEQLLQGSTDRNQLAFAAHYDILPHVTMVMDGFYTNRTSQQQLNPEPLGSNVPTTQFAHGLFVPGFLENGTDPTGLHPVFVLGADGKPIPNLANPTVNPAIAGGVFAPGGAMSSGAGPQDLTSFLTRRFENGDRVFTQDNDTYRLHFALQGTLLDKYDWETGYLYGKSASTQRVFGEVNFQHAAQELGLSACSAGVAAQNGLTGPTSDPCLANFFGFNSLTPAQAKYLIFTNTRTFDTEEQTYYGNVTGPIVQLPAGPLSASVGFEYRNDNTFDQPDSIIANGDGNANAAPSAGSINVGSAYAELNIPVLKDVPFAKSLTFDVSSRYDYYSAFGRSLTYKAGIDWALSEDFRLRGSRSTGFRAPTVKELFGGAFTNNPASIDPCDTSKGRALSAQCIADLKAAGLSGAGITGFQDPINQVQTINGGNTALQPEKSQEWTIGGVFTPRWVPGLSFSTDYYTVLVRNAIAVANDPLDACETPGAAPSGLANPCATITRASGTGLLNTVLDPSINFGAENTSGLEFDLNYGFNSDLIGLPQLGGRFLIDGQASYLLSDNSITDGVVTQGAGTFSTGGDSAEPRWKAQLAGTFAKDNWSVGATERYYGGVSPSVPNQNVGCAEPVTEFGCRAAGVFYTDLVGSFDYKNVHLVVGVDNLLDKQPPFIFGGVSVSQTLTGAGYDILGRFIYSKVSVKF